MRSSPVPVALLALLVLAAAPAGAEMLAVQSAGDAGPAVQAPATPAPQATPQQTAPAPVFTGPAAGQPRTLRAYWHVFGAFAATWLLLFGYALSIGRRFGRLEEELRRAYGPPAG